MKLRPDLSLAILLFTAVGFVNFSRDSAGVLLLWVVGAFVFWLVLGLIEYLLRKPTA